MKELIPREYPRVKRLLKPIPFNKLFARAVTEGYVAGTVFVDNCAAPQTCYIAHPYGMSLLSGSTNQSEFNQALRSYQFGAMPRPRTEWLQVYPPEWSAQLERILGQNLTQVDSETIGTADEQPKVIQTVRVNFRFNLASYTRLRQQWVLPDSCQIVNDLDYIYESMHGSVVPRLFWDSVAQFRKHGAAFAVMHKEKLVSTAFAAFIIDDYLELGIETRQNARGKGYAVHACCALIDYCLDHGLEPVWACRLDNHSSYRLAVKLGFMPELSLPYYELPVTN